MAASNITTTSGLQGVVQKYLVPAWMDLKMEEFRTPLVNSPMALQATIPNNNGQEAEFRKFDHFTPDGALFAETAEPGSSETLQASVVNSPIEELSSFISLGHLLRSTDLINITQKATMLIREKAKRDAHILNTIRFVNNTTITNFGLSRSHTAFTTLFAGGADSFADVTQGNLHRMQDWKNAQSALRNSNVPTVEDGKYIGIIDDAILNKLLDDDKKFLRVLERSPTQSQRDTVFGDAHLVDFNGIRWVMHDDSYRADLDEEGGALATRVAGGKVHVGHLLGQQAFGQVTLGGASPLRPTFKVQDITVTGIETTIAYRIPYQVINLDSEWGLNIAGTTNYSESVSDL